MFSSNETNPLFYRYGGGAFLLTENVSKLYQFKFLTLQIRVIEILYILQLNYSKSGLFPIKLLHTKGADSQENNHDPQYNNSSDSRRIRLIARHETTQVT